MAKKILLIDDDPLVIRTLRRLLEKENYLVECARTGQEGLEKGKDLDFDLIICDIRIPGINGVEIIRELKGIYKKEGRKNIPVIFITGYADQEVSLEALKLEPTDYILKPFDLDRLIDSIRKTFIN